MNSHHAKSGMYEIHIAKTRYSNILIKILDLYKTTLQDIRGRKKGQHRSHNTWQTESQLPTNNGTQNVIRGDQQRLMEAPQRPHYRTSGCRKASSHHPSS